jgi:hypothetical protein
MIVQIYLVAFGMEPFGQIEGVGGVVARSLILKISWVDPESEKSM